MTQVSQAPDAGGVTRHSDPDERTLSPTVDANYWPESHTDSVRPNALRRFYDAYRAPILGVGFSLLLLLIWEYVTDAGFVGKIFLVSPTTVVRRAYVMFFVTGEIYPHLSVSGEEAVLGFAAALLVGVPVGLLVGSSRNARFALEPTLTALYSTPSIALLPLFLLWFGIDLTSKIVLIFLAGVFPIIINTDAGVQNTDPKLVEAARSFGAQRHQILTKIVLPSSLPFIIAGVRLAIGRILITVVVAEFFGALAGIGYLIVNAGNTYDTATLFVGVAIIAGAGVILGQVLRWLEKRVAPWMEARAED